MQPYRTSLHFMAKEKSRFLDSLYNKGTGYCTDASHKLYSIFSTNWKLYEAFYPITSYQPYAHNRRNKKAIYSSCSYFHVQYPYRLSLKSISNSLPEIIKSQRPTKLYLYLYLLAYLSMLCIETYQNYKNPFQCMDIDAQNFLYL